jgi:hypothetical protein
LDRKRRGPHPYEVGATKRCLQAYYLT